MYVCMYMYVHIYIYIYIYTHMYALSLNYWRPSNASDEVAAAEKGRGACSLDGGAEAKGDRPRQPLNRIRLRVGPP